MHVLVINGGARTISRVELTDGLAGVARLIGQSTIDFDPLIDGDRLYFDESCFIRQQRGADQFQFETLAPVSGIGVVVGAHDSGALVAPQLSAEALQARVKFL